MRGGRRPGAGRPKGSKNRKRKTAPPPPDEPEPRPPPITGEVIILGMVVPTDETPKDFLLRLMRNPDLPLAFRRDAAVFALPYCHPKQMLGIKAARDLDALEEGEDELSQILRK